MTFRVSLLIDADGKAAVKEVRRVETAQKDAAKASEALNRKSRGAAGGVDTLGTSAGAGAGRVDTMADANRRAAGSMANLTAQGNDVITMLMAGQDPMQLAIQQGTQINQVWGQMGVKGKDAFKLVGGALMSMLSPINLITIGSIAAAGAMTQWFASAEEDAVTLDETIEGMADGVESFEQRMLAANAPIAEMRKEFGEASPVVRSVLEDLAALGRLDAHRSIDAAAASVRALVVEMSWWDDRSQQSASQDFLGIGNMSSSARQAGALFAHNLQLLRDSMDPAERLAVALDLRSQLLDARGGMEGLNTEQREFYEGLAAIIRDLTALGVKVKEAGSIPAAQRAAMEEYYASRIRGEEFLANARAREAAELMANYQLYAQSRIESDANVAAAQELLGELEQQAELQGLIAAYGEDSAEVAEHRAAAERAAFEEMLATHDVAESLKDEMRAAFEQGLALSQLNLSSNIGAGADEAMRLADWLGVSLETAAKLAALGPQGVPGTTPQQGGRGGDPRDQGGSFSDWQNKEAIVFLENWRPPRVSSCGGGRRGGGSGRASAADKEREAVEKLISGLEDQLAILRETDPVQKEMLRNRDALKGATEAEREAVRGLIETRLDEEEALERHADLADFIKSTGYDLFTGATQGADALTAAASRAAEALADAAFQALLLGEGPLAGILGGSDGGLLGGLADALAGALKGAPARAAGGMVGEPAPRKSDTRTGWRSIEARAAGGMVYGRGDGTSDEELTWLSSGEYVVNAKSTARNRGLLERINSGEDFPRFAAGGSISGGSASPAAVQVSFSIDNRSSAPVQGEIEEVPAQGGGRAYKMVLSDMVGSALTTPGGGARRTLKDGFGVKPRGTKR